jgi:hypothetical protein
VIVSHEHQLIFLKPLKVAGTSFEIALSKYLSSDDIVTPIVVEDETLRKRLGYQGPCNFNYPILGKVFSPNHRGIPQLLGRELPTKYWNHMPASQAKNRLPAWVWRNYRKISLIRNPWDRAVSIFFWKNNRVAKTADVANFSRYFTEQHDAKLSSPSAIRPEAARNWIRDMIARLDANHLHYMIDGQDVIDTYIRYEHFEQDIRALEADIPGLSGLWETFSKITAKAGIRDKSITTAQIFANHPEVDLLVREVNGWEIEKFSYRLS